MGSHRRIMKELADMTKDTSSGMEAVPIDPSNISHLLGRFKGPPDTPYEGGEYTVDIQLPANYPFAPPKMKFQTKVWHPNISSQTGAICLDTLSAKWTPVLTIKTALLSLQSLLSAPEPSDPQDAEVANMMLNDPVAYKKKARDWAQRFAGAPAQAPSSSSYSSASTSSRSILSSAAERQRKLERERERDLQGFDDVTVRRFEELGFSTRDVVRALRSVGARPGSALRMGDELGDRVVEKLLGV